MAIAEQLNCGTCLVLGAERADRAWRRILACTAEPAGAEVAAGAPGAEAGLGAAPAALVVMVALVGEMEGMAECWGMVGLAGTCAAIMRRLWVCTAPGNYLVICVSTAPGEVARQHVRLGQRHAHLYGGYGGEGGLGDGGGASGGGELHVYGVLFDPCSSSRRRLLPMPRISVNPVLLRQRRAGRRW